MKWSFDSMLDNVSRRLAENLTSNMEEVAQNKAARELSELSDPELRKAGISRSKLQQGSKAYPWKASYNEMSKEDLEMLVSQMVHERQSKPTDKIILSA